MNFSCPVLDLIIVVGQEEGPPGEFWVSGLCMFQVYKGGVIGNDNELCACQEGVELSDCKDES